jgi:hypothetical protein
MKQPAIWMHKSQNQSSLTAGMIRYGSLSIHDDAMGIVDAGGKLATQFKDDDAYIV